MARNKRTFDFDGTPPKQLERYPFYHLELDEEQAAFANAIWNPEKQIVFCNSPAGTGKTTVAMGVANLLVRYGFYDGIVGIVSPCEENKQGYLPGDITQKSAVYFEPFYQAMIECNMNPDTDITDEAMVNVKNGTAFVKLMTHTFTRGSNFHRQVVILEEFQNYTISEAKKILTRISDDCKVIVIGHDGQCDLSDRSRSGFVRYLEHFRGDPRCAVCSLATNHRGWISTHADALAV